MSVRISGHSDDIVSLEAYVSDEVSGDAVRVKIGWSEAAPGRDAAGVMVTMIYGGNDSGAVWAATVEQFEDGVPVPWPVTITFRTYTPVVLVGCPEGTPIVAERRRGSSDCGRWERVELAGEGWGQ
jgi:hypothetical protein